MTDHWDVIQQEKDNIRHALKLQRIIKAEIEMGIDGREESSLLLFERMIKESERKDDA